MKALILLLLITITIFQISCTEPRHPNVDPFYTEKGDWDAGRLPLLKPYEALIIAKEFGWAINLQGKYDGNGFDKVKQINVLDTIIFVSTGYTLLNGNYVNHSWHIIIPKNDFEIGFATYDEYKMYVSKLGLKSMPRLYDIDSIASIFDKEDYVDWVKINKENKVK